MLKFSQAQEFGLFLRKKRKQMGYTQSYVAEVSGLSVSFISDVERGKSTVELGKAVLLANLLGIDCLLRDRSGKL